MILEKILEQTKGTQLQGTDGKDKILPDVWKGVKAWMT